MTDFDPFEDDNSPDLFEATEEDKEKASNKGYQIFIAALMFFVFAPPIAALIAGNFAALIMIILFYMMLGSILLCFWLLAMD